MASLARCSSSGAVIRNWGAVRSQRQSSASQRRYDGKNPTTKLNRRLRASCDAEKGRVEVQVGRSAWGPWASRIGK
jgi:hypothetical protein